MSAFGYLRFGLSCLSPAGVVRGPPMFCSSPLAGTRLSSGRAAFPPLGCPLELALALRSLQEAKKKAIGKDGQGFCSVLIFLFLRHPSCTCECTCEPCFHRAFCLGHPDPSPPVNPSQSSVEGPTSVWYWQGLPWPVGASGTASTAPHPPAGSAGDVLGICLIV